MKKCQFIFALFLSTFLFAENKLEVCRGDSGLVGFCNPDGVVVIAQQYFDAHEFVDGFAAVLVEDKWGIIDKNGKLVITPAFDDMIECEHTNWYLVRQDTRWFFVNSLGEPQTGMYDVKNPEQEFELNGAVAEFDANAWFAVSKKEKWGVINLQNEIMVAFEYNWLKVIRLNVNGQRRVSGVVLKNKKDLFAWQDPSGLHTSGFIFEKYLGQNENHLFFLKSGTLLVLEATTGNEIEFSGNSYFTLTNDQGKMGVVNARIGRVVIPFDFDNIDNSQIPNHAITSKGGKVGLANMFGDILLPPEYEEISALSKNPLLIAVKDASAKVAIVAIDANVLRNLTPFKYTFVRPKGDRFYVGIGNQHGYVTMTGEEIWN